nr:reverse transcriptase domain-containing protein [Tanacetum cinerariifolium]
MNPLVIEIKRRIKGKKVDHKILGFSLLIANERKAVILKKLPEKLRDPRKFLIPCGFSELKCKALADLGTSINLMPHSVWKNLGLPELISTCLPELISTRMTLELANRAICTPAGIARDVFVPVGKFTFPTNFVIVDYESDPRFPLILGRPFLRTARALINVHGEEMILRDVIKRKAPTGFVNICTWSVVVYPVGGRFVVNGAGFQPKRLVRVWLVTTINSRYFNLRFGSWFDTAYPRDWIWRIGVSWSRDHTRYLLEYYITIFPIRRIDLYWIQRIELVSFVVFGECRHGYAVSSLMDTAYISRSYDGRSTYYGGIATCTHRGLCRGNCGPPIIAELFKLKHSLINMMTSDQFFRIEKGNPHDHIRWFNKITSSIKYKDVSNSAIKLMLFPFSLAGAACRWLEKELPRSILTWEDLVSKFINEFFPPSRTTNLCNEISNFQQRFDESFHEAWDRYKDLLRACPHHGFTELHLLDTFYNALNLANQDSLNSAAGGNLLERRTQDVLTIIKNKSKVCNSRNKSIVSQIKFSDANSSSSSEIAKLTHAVNQQTSAVTTAMTAILKQFQVTPPPASVKAVEEIFVTCGGAHLYYQCLAAGGNTFSELRDNIQGYVAAAVVNYNQGNFGYRPPGVANQIRPSGFAQPNVQTNQTGLANLKDITKETVSIKINLIKLQLNKINGIVLDGPTVPMPPPFINPEKDERVEETLTDQDLAEYTIKDFLGNLFATNHQGGNLTFSSHPELTSSEVKDDIFDPEGGNALIKKEFADELALITFPLGNDDLLFDIGSDLKEIEYMLNNDPIKEMDSILKDSIKQSNLADLNENLVDTMPKMFIDEHALDYSSPPLYDEYDDDCFKVEFDTEYVYDDPFESKGEKTKESKLLINELDLPRSSDFLPSPEYDSFLFENFSEVDALPSANKKDKMIAISHASLILEDFDPHLYELPFHKEVLRNSLILKTCAKGFILQSSLPQLQLGIIYQNLID